MGIEVIRNHPDIPKIPNLAIAEHIGWQQIDEQIHILPVGCASCSRNLDFFDQDLWNLSWSEVSSPTRLSNFQVNIDFMVILEHNFVLVVISKTNKYWLLAILHVIVVHLMNNILQEFTGTLSQQFY